MVSKKNICIAFLGNPEHDSRVYNLYNSLLKDNFDVSVISFDWYTKSEKLSDKFVVNKLTRKQGSIYFYFSFGVVLFKLLWKTKADIYFAEDIYTLPLVVLFAKMRKAKVFYNSREIYAFIGGLAKRPFLQKIITRIESKFIKKVDLVLTTGEMDTEFIKNFYKVNNVITVRNIPLLQKPQSKVNLRELFNIPQNYHILLYQGILIGGRGIPIILETLTKIKNAVLILLGDGAEKASFQKIAEEKNVSDRVIFVGTVPQKELINYTSSADIGLALIENISVSYYHALPNKLFEYIMAGIPIISSELPQMKRIVDLYEVGKVVNIDSINSIVDAINEILQDESKLSQFKNNCLKGAQELNWEVEYKTLQKELLKLN